MTVVLANFSEKLFRNFFSVHLKIYSYGKIYIYIGITKGKQ